MKGRAPPMRSHLPLLGAALFVGAVTTVVFAQPRPPAARPGAARPPAARPGARPAARADGGAAPAATVDGGASPAAAVDGGASDATAAVVDPDAGSVTVGDASFPMRQVGTGTIIHFPVPEQLQRTGVPVFAQVRSSAPIDHVSLYVRALGARRYTEIRMQAMGQQFRLASGYGAMIPCEDVLPRRSPTTSKPTPRRATPTATPAAPRRPWRCPSSSSATTPPRRSPVSPRRAPAGR